jgi:hypothetical protein
VSGSLLSLSTTDHNQYIHNGLVWQANYCAGLHVLNITSPSTMEEIAFFDTSNNCGSSNPWLGAWSNYPFFGSGNIVVSSIEMGLFILKVRDCLPDCLTACLPALHDMLCHALD